MITDALDLRLSEGLRTNAVTAAAAIGERLLEELKDTATDTKYEERAPSRGFGSSSGYAVLYAALVQATGEQRFVEAMRAHIRAAASLGDRPGIGVQNGMSGLRAALAYLSPMEPGADALITRCDAYIDGFGGAFDTFAQTYLDYDLLFGWAGARLARCLDGPLPRDRWTDMMVRLLEDESHWLCPHPVKRDEPSEHSLGFAHGAPGVATALALSLDEIDDAAAAAITRALDFVISYKQVRSGLITWPHTAQDPEPMRFRAAWCFGSAGVALALAQCGERLQNWVWLEHAHATFDSMLDVPTELWELGELNLCHGKIGVALIFRRASQLLGDERFFRRAEQLVNETVAELMASRYRQITHGFDGKPFDSLGTLTGIAGIALGLLDLADAADGRWKCLYGIGS
jgi:lantibiotic modifying enzyme